MRSICSDLPHKEPSHSEVCCRRCRQVTLRFCSLPNPPSSTALPTGSSRLDRAVRDGDAGDEREVALGDAERHVDAPRIAPARNDAAAAQDQSVRPATRCRRPENLVVRCGSNSPLPYGRAGRPATPSRRVRPDPPRASGPPDRSQRLRARCAPIPRHRPAGHTGRSSQPSHPAPKTCLSALSVGVWKGQPMRAHESSRDI